MLEADGWSQVRQKGSHRVFKHADKGGIVAIAGAGSKDVPPGTLKAILEQARIER